MLTNLEIGVIIINVIEKVNTIIGQSKNINQKSWLYVAFQILKKVFPNAYANGVEVVVFQPIKVNCG